MLSHLVLFLVSLIQLDSLGFFFWYLINVSLPHRTEYHEALLPSPLLGKYRTPMNSLWVKEGKNSPALASLWRKWCQSQHIHVCLQTLLSEHVLNPHLPLCLHCYHPSPGSLHLHLNPSHSPLCLAHLLLTLSTPLFSYQQFRLPTALGLSDPSYAYKSLPSGLCPAQQPPLPQCPPSSPLQLVERT